MLTAKQFAEAIARPYPTVMGWLQGKRIPGAKLIESPIGSYYEIPASLVLNFEAPKRGRPRKADEAAPEKPKLTRKKSQ